MTRLSFVSRDDTAQISVCESWKLPWHHGSQAIQAAPHASSIVAVLAEMVAFIRDANLQRKNHCIRTMYRSGRFICSATSAATALLTHTIDEEGNADHVLSAIAERLNLDAKQAAWPIGISAQERPGH